MKFTVERRALVKMLEVIGRKAPSKKWRDKEVRLSACDARVFVEANESTGGVEALVFEDGTCFLEHKIFLKLLKMHPDKQNIIFEANDHKITFATTTIPVSKYSPKVVSPGKFKVFAVTDDWVSPRSSESTIKTPLGGLPNADKAIVERAKILRYLLNPNHPFGASKANFFVKFGFHAKHWEQLAKALLTHGQTHEVKRVKETSFGPRFEVEGKLETPDGRVPLIRTVWQMDKDAVAPRLITAYPLEAR